MAVVLGAWRRGRDEVERAGPIVALQRTQWTEVSVLSVCRSILRTQHLFTVS